MNALDPVTYCVSEERLCKRCRQPYRYYGKALLCSACSTPEAKPLLTPGEARLVELVATGAKDREIATQLNTTVGTVRGYIHRLRIKTGVSQRMDLRSLASVT